MKPGISAIIVVSNQLDLLKKCLKSIHNSVDEIILIDLESTEDIKTLATFYKAKYVLSKKVEIVEEIRQSSLSYAGHEYVLFLDPDETIPETLLIDLKQKIESGEFDYFVTPRQNFVFGKWVNHSRWWPDFQTRLFKQGSVSWGTTLHAEVEKQGKGFTYEADPKYAIHHENYRDLDEFILKNMRYAKHDANTRIAAGEKYSLITAMRLSISELVSRFYVGEGYRDGMHGLMLSVLQSYYYFLVYGYYWEAKKYQNLESESSVKSFPLTWFKHGLFEIIHWGDKPHLLGKIKNKLARRLLK